MSKFISLLLLQLICCALSAQHFSVANEKQNIFYLGVDNPVSIIVENIADKQLIVRTDNGSIKRMYGGYIYHGSKVGKAAIVLYKKVNGKLKEIGRSEFRVKNIPLPVFKLGQSGSNRVISNVVLKAPLYVRAELEDFDFDARFTIDSFRVCVVRHDTCVYLEKWNYGNGISEDIRVIFQSLKPGDTIMFKSIFATGPDRTVVQLAPCILFVTDDKSRILSTVFNDSPRLLRHPGQAFTIHYSQFTTHHSPFTTHYSPHGNIYQQAPLDSSCAAIFRNHHQLSRQAGD